MQYQNDIAKDTREKMKYEIYIDFKREKPNDQYK